MKKLTVRELLDAVENGIPVYVWVPYVAAGDGAYVLTDPNCWAEILEDFGAYDLTEAEYAGDRKTIYIN